MLSKEEIEKARRYFEDEIHYEKTTYNCVNHYRQTIIDNHIILYKYIEQLETREQKLIEKLEERIKSVEKCYEEMITDIGGIKIINVTGLSKKEKEETLNKRNCLLVQKATYEEILEILKGGKNER